MLISKPESYGNKNAKKYIIGYNDDVIISNAYFSLKLMVTLNVLMIIRQCLFLLMIKNF